MDKLTIAKCIEKKDLIIWNDPDPIQGCNYTVHKIWNVTNDTAMIHYGEDVNCCSEAEVYLSELSTLSNFIN